MSLTSKYKIGSPKTSMNQIAAGFKKIEWARGSINLDIGGGMYNKATEYLKVTHDVTNYVYDPYNRPLSRNTNSWDKTKYAPTSTIFNVLNVIDNKLDRLITVQNAKREGTKAIYITVYEKNKSSKGSWSTRGWQNNMKTIEYLEEIQEIFPQANKEKNMIVIRF